MSLRSLMKKFFHLPGPRELGWSEHDALGSSHFTPFQEGKTWEEWAEHVKKQFPVTYFFAETVPMFLAPYQGKISRAWYWLQCKVLPSYKFHLIDLRGVDPQEQYTHGYIDPCSVMELACWKALRSYLEEEEPNNPADWATPEELKEPHLAAQYARHLEFVELHDWWMKGRAEEQTREDELFRAVEVARKAKNKEEYETASKPWLEYHRWREEHREEMFLRLCRLRPHLWT